MEILNRFNFVVTNTKVLKQQYISLEIQFQICKIFKMLKL